MNNKVWLDRTVQTVHTLCGIYGPTYTVSGLGESVRVAWMEFDVHWRRPGRFDGVQLADQLRVVLREKS